MDSAKIDSPKIEDTGGLPGRIALGAISGAILACALEPILALLPELRLPRELLASAVVEGIKILAVIAVAVLATRIRRLDWLLEKHLPSVALLSSVLLAAALWGNAGWPRSWTALGVSFLAALAAMIFVYFCGWVAYEGTRQLTDEQAQEHQIEREKEAREIAAKAVMAGDPDPAIAIFAQSALGTHAEAMRTGCLFVFLQLTSLLAIGLGAFLEAYLLYRLSVPWSLVITLVLLAATQPIVSASLSVGKTFARAVPLSEKAGPIVPESQS